MSVYAAIVDGPVGAEHERAAASAAGPGAGGVGAVVRFEGIVRRLEDGRALDALHYQTYEPMAQRELERLGAEVVARCGLLELRVIHSRGRVGAGECSLVLEVRSAHRRDALRAVDEFIDVLKCDVPIWKRAVWAEGGT